MLDFFFFTKICALFLVEIDKNLSALSCDDKKSEKKFLDSPRCLFWDKTDPPYKFPIFYRFRDLTLYNGELVEYLLDRGKARDSGVSVYSCK